MSASTRDIAIGSADQNSCGISSSASGLSARATAAARNASIVAEVRA
jgi:hypothetical protein